MRMLAGLVNWFGIVGSAYITVVLGIAKGDFAAFSTGLLFLMLFARDLLIAVDRENTLVEFRKYEWGSDNPVRKETKQ